QSVLGSLKSTAGRQGVHWFSPAKRKNRFSVLPCSNPRVFGLIRSASGSFLGRRSESFADKQYDQHTLSDEGVAMIITKKALARRTFLRGVGTAVALPLLDAMIPSMTALAQTSAAPQRLRRLGYVYMPMGCDRSRWTPSGDRLDELTPSLAPLAPGKEHVTVISNLGFGTAYPGPHAPPTSSFLSAARPTLTERADYSLGTTADQIAARQIGRDTQLPSLELSMDLMSLAGQCDNGYACVYQNNLSWSSP